MADNAHTDESGETRRDFLYLSTAAMAAVGVGTVAWPFIDQMNPAKDVLALATVEVNIDALEEGQSITVSWRGKPVFIRYRTAEEIETARSVDLGALPDPQADGDRVENEKYLVLVGVCTHLGCIPLGQKTGDAKGDFGGWFCPCHGSHYDTSGRIRRGPAPSNLAVPEYEFLDETTVRLG